MRRVIATLLLAALTGSILSAAAEARRCGFLCAFGRGFAEGAGRRAAEQILKERKQPPPSPRACAPPVTCRVINGPCGYEGLGRYGCHRREACAKMRPPCR